MPIFSYFKEFLFLQRPPKLKKNAIDLSIILEMIIDIAYALQPRFLSSPVLVQSGPVWAVASGGHS